MTQNWRKNTFSLVAWLSLCFAVSAIGAFASINAQSFYSQLQQPSWAPPPWVFGPVWTTLYIMMAVSVWLVWLTPKSIERRIAIGLFLGQLFFNALWSWLFFAWHLGGVAFFEVIILWIAIVATLLFFWRVRVLAGVLMIPYITWVSFAALLNYSLWRLNPQLLS